MKDYLDEDSKVSSILIKNRPKNIIGRCTRETMETREIGDKRYVDGFNTVNL